MTTTVENNAAAQAMREQWNRAAQGWADSGPKIRQWLQEATPAMLKMAGVKRGDRVLDVAAGAGDQTLDAAAIVGPDGHVLATDLSPGILEQARRAAAAAGYQTIETRESEGESLKVESDSFDTAICRLALMLFRDPLQGLKEMRRALKPGGGICTMVFSSPDANPCITALMSTALRHAGLPPRDPFTPGGLLSLGKPGMIDQLLRDAGFRDVATTKMAAPFRLPSVADFVQFLRTSAGPIVDIVERLEPAKRNAAWADIETALGRFTTASGWEGPNELLLTAARK